ncbi:MAG TPA: hypothetical protein VGF88_00675 [Acidobacteriaceae bacterium]|jgi:hypothetical protein
MKTTIRTIALATFVAIASLSTTMHAQTIQARVNVPFSFDCGAAHLSAGVYTLSVESGHVLTLRSSNNYAVMAVVQTAYNPTPAALSQATFKKYGDRYFLEQIRTGGSLMETWVSESDSEKRAAHEYRTRGEAGSQIALALLPMDLRHAGN